MNQKGREIAAQRGETQLFFTDFQHEAENTDIYLTAGALQYFDIYLVDILKPLKNRPKHVIVNRVPLSEKEEFYTLQHMGYSIVPYHIGNLSEFVASMNSIGYRLVERWKNNRFCDIILRPDKFVPHYYGFYFQKEGA